MISFILPIYLYRSPQCWIRFHNLRLLKMMEHWRVAQAQLPRAGEEEEGR